MTTILITGAGRGIGFELARQSAQMGWNVLGSVRSVEAQKELAEKLPEMTVFNFDVTDHDAIEKVSSSLHFPIDVLVNNAGIIGPDVQSTLDMDFEGFAKDHGDECVCAVENSTSFPSALKAGEQPQIGQYFLENGPNGV